MRYFEGALRGNQEGSQKSCAFSQFIASKTLFHKSLVEKCFSESFLQNKTLIKG